jgi:hypothetical protein
VCGETCQLAVALSGVAVAVPPPGVVAAAGWSPVSTSIDAWSGLRVVGFGCVTETEAVCSISVEGPAAAAGVASRTTEMRLVTMTMETAAAMRLLLMARTPRW